MKQYKYITYNKDILGGKPIVAGTRISVDLILEWVATEATIAEISKSYPQLSEAAIQEAIYYASEMAKNEVILEAKVA
jgi:uncharacterized protein (DUF433 family)